jgi:hypothetical protein
MTKAARMIIPSKQLPKLMTLTHGHNSKLAQMIREAPDGKMWEVSVKRHSKSRSVEQNRLQRLWLREAQEQGDQTAEEYRAYCKLHFGVPIMCRDSDEFAEVYGRLIRPRPYEEKLELMAVPMDLPVTRIMTVKQKEEYLSAMCRNFVIERGFRLTEPRGYL